MARFVVVEPPPGFLDLWPVEAAVDVGGSLFVVAAVPLDASDRESSVAAAVTAVAAVVVPVVAVVVGRWLVAVVLRGGAMIQFTRDTIPLHPPV